jgi:hypothetical protein
LLDCSQTNLEACIPVTGIITAIHDRDNSDCKFLMPATSTQSGPIVY